MSETPKKMKFCPGCQASLELNVKTCPYCSTKQFTRAEVLLQDFLKSIFPKKNPATFFLLFFNIALFIMVTIDVTMHPDFSLKEAMLAPPGEIIFRWGAQIRGELTWWRLFTANFIHIGLIHILFNSVALRYVGPLVERYFGSAITFVSYILLGTFSMLISNVAPTSSGIVAGASGAIMAWVGMVAVAAHLEKTTAANHLRNSMLTMIVATVLFGVLVNASNDHGIDNIAHIAGLAAGAIAGFLLPKQSLTGYTNLTIPRVATILTIASLITSIVAFAHVATSSTSIKYQNECIQAIDLKQYKKAEIACQKAYEADSSQTISYHNYILTKALNKDYEGARQLCDEGYARFDSQRKKGKKISFDALCQQLKN